MKRYVYLLLFPALFLISCGDDANQPGDDTNKVAERDYFREGVDKLKRNGFLQNYSGAKLDSLVNVYRSDSMNGMQNLLVASGDMLHISIGTENRTELQTYADAIDSISMKWPDLKPSAIKTKYLPNFPGGKDTGWVLLEQQFGNQWYSRKLYVLEGWPVDNFMYRGYNTYLADQNKDTRLYLAQFYTNARDTGAVDDFLGNMDVTRMGLMRLTQQQADSLMNIPQLPLEPEPEFNTYTTSKVDAELQKLWSTGLFSNEKWFDTIAADVRHNTIYRQQDIIDFYDEYFSTVQLDTLNMFNPYEDILTSLSDKSRGFFEPTGVHDEAIGQTAVHGVRFTLNGKIYEKDFEPRNGIQSPYFLDFVNNALTEQGVKGAFYTVSYFNNIAIVIFIEDDEIDTVVKAGFFLSVEKGAPSEMKIIYGDEPAKF